MKTLILAALTLFLSACGGAKNTSQGGSVVFSVSPSDAYIYINKEKIGKVQGFSTDESALKLSSGTHKITISKDGFFPQSFEINIGESQELIKADLKSALKN